MTPDFDPKTQIAIIWSIEDVQHVRPQLNDKQTMEVLDRIKRHHDCNLGVTWETLRIVAADINIKVEDIDAYPCHITCNSCGCKQYDADAVKAHCDKTGEDSEIGSYICGVCLDNNETKMTDRIRLSQFSEEELNLYYDILHAHTVEDVLSKYDYNDETASDVADRARDNINKCEQYFDA
ncbi:MAG: hypothetical protein FWC82_04200, partial [Firmicutes bacterium]|nr:hypothetical protein [Bacillota bacterium]